MLASTKNYVDQRVTEKVEEQVIEKVESVTDISVVKSETDTLTEEEKVED